MGSYVPNTPEERQEMLRAIGLHDFRELGVNVVDEITATDER